jgi:hypothetical protein
VLGHWLSGVFSLPNYKTRYVEKSTQPYRKCELSRKQSVNLAQII